MAHQARRGRPDKGDRDSGFFTRPAAPVGALIRERAAALNMPYGEYIAFVLAEVHGFPQYATWPAETDVLPLKTA